MNMADISDPALANSRDIIDRRSGDLSRLLDDLLDVARVTQGKISLKPEEFSLRQLLEEIVRDQRDAGSMHCDILLELPDDELPVKGDRLRIKQVFLNLLNNADKFSDEDGEITVKASVTGGEVAISVRDRGIGIPRDMLDSVFHLFSQAARTTRDTKGGLGIGLTVVQSLVHMHQGRVTVASEGAGKGSEFTVYLPKLLCPSRRSRAGRVPGHARRAEKSLRLLVVDDDRDGGLSLKALLEADQHRVTVCADGRAGLIQARTLRPDAIILDIGLPDCSGYEIARLLRSDPSFSDTLFIALTGYGSDQDRRRAKEAGFDHHLTKPINFAALGSILRAPAQRVGSHPGKAAAAPEASSNA
jgi:CheY-like chemotaxis protein/anti-sigma regulatory factor (Ser/Thr protein kinase)